MSQPAWDELYGILRETAEILNQGDSASANTLEQRTRQLARQVSEENVSLDARRFLTFSLGTERYGWPVGRVRAIARVERLTPVPSAPAYYRGVVSLRGQVLSVMDLRLYLGLPASEQQASPEFMIVIDGAGLEIGMLANEVYDVLSVPLSALAPASSAGLDAELVIGVTTDGLTLLDAEAVLRRERYRIESEDDKK